MPLSDHEREQLKQIEDELLADHPGLRASSRLARLSRISRHTSLLLLGAGIVLGLVLLYTGLRLADGSGTVVGVLGWLIIVAVTYQAWCAIWTPQIGSRA